MTSDMAYKVGDTVRVRSWESMEREYGLDQEGDIYTPARMCIGMKEFCGRAFKITDIHDDWYRSSHFSTFWFTDDMLEPEFMVGDIVECVDSSGTIGVICGRMYNVKSTSGEYTIINEHPNMEFYSSRFKLIKREDKKYTGVPEFTKMMACLGKEPTEKFYMVFREDSRLPEVKHTSAAKATAEAQRLSRKHPGSKVFILETVDCFLCSVSEPESVELEEL